MAKLRLSWTLLNLWTRGETDEAVLYYFKLKTKESEALKEGKVIDSLIFEKIEKEKKLPEFMGKIKLTNPQSQLKIEIEYNKLFDLVGVIDCYDEGVIYEFKSGKIPSISYAQSPQLWLYTLLLKEKNYPVEKIMVVRYNQHKDEADATMVWYSDKLLKKAKDYIDGIAPEIYDFFDRNGLLLKV